MEQQCTGSRLLMQHLKARHLKILVPARAHSGACQDKSQGAIHKVFDPNVGCRAEQVVGTFWRWVAQPLLFGLIGTGVNFHTIKASTLPKSLIVVLAGAFPVLPSKSACSGDYGRQSACSALTIVNSGWTQHVSLD